MIKHIKNTVVDELMLVLLAALEAMDYYPHIGLDAANYAWIILRGE